MDAKVKIGLLVAVSVLTTGFIMQGPLSEGNHSGFHGSWHAYLCSGPEAGCGEESHLRGASTVWGGVDICDDYEPGAGDLGCQTIYAVSCTDGDEAVQLITSSFDEGEATMQEFVNVTCGEIGGGGH